MLGNLAPMWFFGVLPGWVIIAQQNPLGGNGDVAALATLVAQVGLSAIFLWQWRDERRERRELTKTMMDWIERFGPALEASTGTLASVQKGMASQFERTVRGSASDEIHQSISRLERTVEELSEYMYRAKDRSDDDGRR